MRIVELQDPIIRFVGENLDNLDPKKLWVAAFESDQNGDPLFCRPAGVHLSTIIHYLTSKIEKFPDHSKQEDGGQTAKNAKMGVGIAWETVLSWAIGKVYPSSRIVYPGYFTCDGVIMNPDRYDYVDNVLEEYKATWYSYRKASTPQKFAEFFWWWIIQAKAYCRELHTLKARFRVFFLNGDYAPPMPKPKQWQLEFSPAELESNWKMILTTGKEMGLLK